MLSWPISLRYLYDLANWSVLFMCQWGVAKTSQIGPCHWRTSWDVSTYMRRKWDVITTWHAGWKRKRLLWTYRWVLSLLHSSTITFSISSYSGWNFKALKNGYGETVIWLIDRFANCNNICWSAFLWRVSLVLYNFPADLLFKKNNSNLN